MTIPATIASRIVKLRRRGFELGIISSITGVSQRTVSRTLLSSGDSNIHSQDIVHGNSMNAICEAIRTGSLSVNKAAIRLGVSTDSVEKSLARRQMQIPGRITKSRKNFVKVKVSKNLRRKFAA